MSSPTANWDKVGDLFYRKVQLYDAVFDEELGLENYIVAGAPYGGAIGDLSRQSVKSDLMTSQLSIEMRQSYILSAELRRPNPASISTVAPGS